MPSRLEPWRIMRRTTAAIAWRRTSPFLGKGEVALRNDNFDVGETTARGQYRLEDNACAQLLDELAKKEFSEASPELRADLLRFFSSSDIPSSDRLSEKARTRLKGDVQALEKVALPPPVAKN